MATFHTVSSPDPSATSIPLSAVPLPAGDLPEEIAGELPELSTELAPELPAADSELAEQGPELVSPHAELAPAHEQLAELASARDELTLELPQLDPDDDAPGEVLPLPGRLVNHLHGLSIAARELHELLAVLRETGQLPCAGLLERLAEILSCGLEREVVDRAARGIRG